MYQKNNQNHKDVYQIVTDAIVAELEQGRIPWEKPWNARPGHWVGRKTHTETRTIYVAVSRATGKPYSGMNQMLLNIPGEWATFDEIQKAGGRVVKGSKSRPCVYWKLLEKEKVDENGDPVLDDDGKPVKVRIPFLRYYSVFHVETMTTGIKPRHDGAVQVDRVVVDDPGHIESDGRSWGDIPAADDIFNAYIKRTGVVFNETQQDEAFYRPFNDSINMPLREQFKTAAGYYGTLFHETVHSTGRPDRCNRERELVAHRWGDDNYAKEELVAEIGSCMINNTLGIETANEHRNTVAYCQSWAAQLKKDRKLVVTAAARAEKAADFIFGDGEQEVEQGE